MRHFLSQRAVALLAHRVHSPTSSAPLVLPTRGSLPCAPLPPRALRPAVPRLPDVAHRAQHHHEATPGAPTDDDVQRDHGPARRDARHPRGPVRPRMGRTATSRSSGAIEGAEVQAPRPRYMCVTVSVTDRAATMPRAVVTVLTFTATAWSPRRGDRCSSPRSVVTTYAAINTRRLSKRTSPRHTERPGHKRNSAVLRYSAIGLGKDDARWRKERRCS
jgi:hypothetical protein